MLAQAQTKANANVQSQGLVNQGIDSAELSALEQLFYKDDFFRTVLIGFAGGFGLSTLLILLSLELTSLVEVMTNQVGVVWFLVPAFTVIGVSAWTFMLIRIRRHRHTKILRKEAFEKQQNPGADQDGPARSAEEEATHDPSQDDWL